MISCILFIAISSRFIRISPWIPSSPSVLLFFSLFNWFYTSILQGFGHSLSLGSYDIHVKVSEGFSQLSSWSKYSLHFSRILSCSIIIEPSSFFKNLSCFLYPPLIAFIFWYSSRVLLTLWLVSASYGISFMNLRFSNLNILLASFWRSLYVDYFSLLEGSLNHCSLASFLLLSASSQEVLNQSFFTFFVSLSSYL